jgi:hypothetical protein
MSFPKVQSGIWVLWSESRLGGTKITATLLPWSKHTISPIIVFGDDRKEEENHESETAP